MKIKLTIKNPFVGVDTFLHIFRSTRAADLDSMSALALAEEIMIVHDPNGAESVTVYDRIEQTNKQITYYGPQLSQLPVPNASFSLGQKKCSLKSYWNTICISCLPTKTTGQMYYYAVVCKTADHRFSKFTLASVFVPYLVDDQLRLEVELSGKETRMDYSEDINRLGTQPSQLMVVEPEMPKIPSSIFTVDVQELNYYHTIKIQFPNLFADPAYNYRAMKSLRIRYKTDRENGPWSDVVQLGNVKVTIEKIELLQKDITETQEDAPLDLDSCDAVKTVYLKDGIYDDHSIIPCNQYVIPLEQSEAVFSETAPQSLIKLQFLSYVDHRYKYQLYATDVYGNRYAAEPWICEL